MKHCKGIRLALTRPCTDPQTWPLPCAGECGPAVLEEMAASSGEPSLSRERQEQSYGAQGFDFMDSLCLLLSLFFLVMQYQPVRAKGFLDSVSQLRQGFRSVPHHQLPQENSF